MTLRTINGTVHRPVDGVFLYLTSPKGELRNALYFRTDGTSLDFLDFPRDVAFKKFQKAITFWLKVEQQLRNNSSPQAPPRL